jgi:hypothetical protein
MPLKVSRPLLALGALLLLASATGAKALDLGVKVGGVDVGVSVGGSSGVGVDVGVGDSDVSVGVGGGGSAGGLGVDLDVDLDGDGDPETSSGGQSIQPLGQEGALKAVQSNRALPLEDILTRARLVAEGEIIDAQLIQVRRILVYEIKVLGKAGDVRELYFYARSGALVAPK